MTHPWNNNKFNKDKYSEGKMCCCIPLRRLSYFGAFMHMILGLVYFYDCGSVAYTMYKNKDKEGHEERLYLGLLYIGYYAAFLPPGIFIFWGVHKKLRCYLAIPSAILLIIQTYGVTLECYFKFRPHWVPDVMEAWEEVDKVNKLKADYWMDIGIQVSVALSYIFMLFFYYREIGPEAPPIQSRYAQAYLQQLQEEQEMHQQHLAAQQSMVPQLPLGPPVPFRPVSQPHSLGASNTNIRNASSSSSNTPLPPQQTPLNFAALNLSFEQQQQLLKLQQHPILMHQLQQFQQMHPHHSGGGHQQQHHVEEIQMQQVHPQHHHVHRHSHHQQQSIALQQQLQQLDQINQQQQQHPLFLPYQMIPPGGGAPGGGGDKTPKF